MIPACQGEQCRYYLFHRDVWKMNRETGEYYKVNGYHCHAKQAQTNYTPNKKTGGVPIGKVCWECKGQWYDPRGTT